MKPTTKMFFFLVTFFLTLFLCKAAEHIPNRCVNDKNKYYEQGESYQTEDCELATCQQNSTFTFEKCKELPEDPMCITHAADFTQKWPDCCPYRFLCA